MKRHFVIKKTVPPTSVRKSSPSNKWSIKENEGVLNGGGWMNFVFQKQLVPWTLLCSESWYPDPLPPSPPPVSKQHIHKDSKKYRNYVLINLFLIHVWCSYFDTNLNNLESSKTNYP